MKAKITALITALAVGTVVMLGVGVVEANPPSLVRPHRHYIESSAGEKVYMGPNFCDVTASDQGFAAFHHKVHVKDPGLVDVKSEPC